MNILNPIKKTPACFMTCLIMAMAAMSANAQTPLQAQLAARPLTPAEIANTNYGLPSGTEISAGSGPGGLFVCGVGQAVYLEADVNLAIPAADITSVSWVLSSAPVGSEAALATSPLGTNVPVYEPSDRLVCQVAGRMLLRPDLAGTYTVTASIVTASEGTTNLSMTITASTYMGIDTCALCHSGSEVAPDQVHPWSGTAHATIFTKGIDGDLGLGPLYDGRCLPCHTVGYDTNTNAVNGGFDDVMAQLHWTMPTVITNGNWASMESNYPSLANLANIQCENCHGPGNNHAYSLGNPNLISINFGSGNCAQCHDEPPGHSKVAEWDNSAHAITTRDPSGPGREQCVGCHTAPGFLGETDTNAPTITTYVPINCVACHDAHDASNPHQIRVMSPVTLMNGTVVTKGGEGLLCMNCHHAREDAATYATSYHSYFGPHHGPQADMLAGANGFDYGQTIPSSAHINAVTNSCVTCHMQTVAKTDPDFTHVGGHTFNAGWDGDTNHPAEDLVAACQQCHGQAITDFDFPLQDYDGDGVIQGVQTEVQNLLNKLSTLLPNASGMVDGLVKTPSPTASWTAPQLEADYNWQFVNNDGSLGIHNTAYAVGLLKASIANLTGDANNDGLPDSWQTNYFGTINNPSAAPDAVNNSAGIPNWMMYALGLNPFSSFTVGNSGVIYFDGNNIVNGATNTVAIYKAAEIAFNTQVGVNYQIQGISSLSGGWVDISTNIPGTGGSISYLTPTRNNAQMFFRLISSSAP
jgi:hypothetical protein